MVVGASRGIGAAIADALAGAGADVALASRSAETLAGRRRAIESRGHRTFVVPLDLRDPASVSSGIDRAAELLGGLDIVVNSGGISPIFKRVERTAVAEWDEIFAVNARGTFLLAQAAGRHLLPQGSGSLILVSSVHEQVGHPRLAAYAASKGAVRLFARSLALEWAERGVRVNLLAPGYVETDMTAGIRSNPRLHDDVIGAIPMGRITSPEEVASTAVFLASDASRYMTGSTLVVDGGLTAQ